MIKIEVKYGQFRTCTDCELNLKLECSSQYIDTTLPAGAINES